MSMKKWGYVWEKKTTQNSSFLANSVEMSHLLFSILSVQFQALKE